MINEPARYKILAIWVLVSILLSALDALVFLVSFSSGPAFPVAISLLVSIGFMMFTILGLVVYLRQSMELDRGGRYPIKSQLLMLILLAAFVFIRYWDYFSPYSHGDVLRETITVLSYLMIALVAVLVGYVRGPWRASNRSNKE